MGEKSYKKLSKKDQDNCIEKLKFFKTSDTFQNNIRPVQNLLPATHRLRIGHLRLLIRFSNEHTINILKIGNRGDIYK